MKTLLLVALIALTTASYFSPEQTQDNVKFPVEEEENYEKDSYVPSQNSYSNDNDSSDSSDSSYSSYSSDSSDSSDSNSESEVNERRGRPQMRGSHKGEGRHQRSEGQEGNCHGKEERGQRGQRNENNGNEQRRPNHRKPEPRPQPDEFDIQAFHTLKDIGHGIIEEWKLAEDPALKNEIRAALIAKLENLIPVVDIPNPEASAVPVPAPEVIPFEQVRVIEEGGN